MNFTQVPDDETATLASASSVSITPSALTNTLSKKKRKHHHKDHNKQPKLIHQLIQPPLDDDEDEESDSSENEESTEEQLALYEYKTHKKMKLNNGEEHTISDTDEQNKYEEDTEEEDDDDDDEDEEDESQESQSSSNTPSENEEQINDCHIAKEGQEKEEIDKDEHKDQGNLCDSMEQSEEDNDEEDEDEEYVVTEEDLAQHRNDKVLNCLWSEEALTKLEIDELDEPIDESCDVEGFDVEEVMNDEKKKKYIENLMECLPPYMYCITQEDKQLFFENLNKEFKRNLEESDTHVSRSHERKVNFDFASAQVIEFDLNKKVKNISKLPILKGVEDVPAI